MVYTSIISEYIKAVIQLITTALNTLTAYLAISQHFRSDSLGTHCSRPNIIIVVRARIHRVPADREHGVYKSIYFVTSPIKDYKNCLFNQTEYFHRQRVIRSHKHDIFTEEVKKKSLSWKDDKRYLLPNSTDTLAYGHVLVSS